MSPNMKKECKIGKIFIEYLNDVTVVFTNTIYAIVPEKTQIATKKLILF